MITMDVRIQAIHFEATPKLVDFINKKAERLARRYPSLTEMEVSLRVIKPETSMNKEVIIKLAIPQREDAVATKVADTFEEAIDLGLEALDRQLEKVKDKK